MAFRALRETAPGRILSLIPENRSAYPRLASVTSLERTLERMLTHRSPDELLRWIDAECARPSAGDLLALVDAAFDSVVGRLDIAPDAIAALLRDARESARERIADRDASADVEAAGMSARASANVLLVAMQAHDADTAQHMRECGVLARRFALELGLRTNDVVHVELAAMLHDIGKIAVPALLLRSPNKLTRAEWAHFLEHPQRGAEIVSGVAALADLAPTIIAHHERIDGTGYPAKTKGCDIPLTARILSIVDSFHAMTSHRPYRQPLPMREAIAQLSACSNTQFDADLADAFIAMISDRRVERRLSA